MIMIRIESTRYTIYLRKVRFDSNVWHDSTRRNIYLILMRAWPRLSLLIESYIRHEIDRFFLHWTIFNSSWFRPCHFNCARVSLIFFSFERSKKNEVRLTYIWMCIDKYGHLSIDRQLLFDPIQLTWWKQNVVKSIC
jgi:hypothetical protein